MASSTSKLIMLFLLVGVGACVVEGISSERTTAEWNTNKAEKEAADDNIMARVTMPSILMDHASPLDTKTASLYAAKIEDGSIAQNAKDFCVEAKLLCDANVNLIDPSLDISLKNLLEGGSLLERVKAMVDASQAMFFGPKELVAGKDIKMPTTLHDQYPTTSFLPQSLAKLMPLSGDKVAELLQKLNIPPTSNLAVMMSRTMAQCDAKAQQRRSGATAAATKDNLSSGICVTSMEDMMKFVADRFPQDSRIAALERTISAATDAAPLNVAKSGTSTYKVLDVKEYERSVVCHKNMFPFAVYECHNMDNNKDKNVDQDNMKMYAVTMESHEDGREMNQIASCRADVVGSEKTRKIIPGPLAAEAAACHWLSDAFVWAPATHAGKVDEERESWRTHGTSEGVEAGGRKHILSSEEVGERALRRSHRSSTKLEFRGKRLFLGDPPFRRDSLSSAPGSYAVYAVKVAPRLGSNHEVASGAAVVARGGECGAGLAGIPADLEARVCGAHTGVPVLPVQAPCLLGAAPVRARPARPQGARGR